MRSEKKPINLVSDDDEEEEYDFEQMDVLSSDMFAKEDEKMDEAETSASNGAEFRLSGAEFPSNGAEIFSKKQKNVEDEEITTNCVICMDELENGQASTLLSKCNHRFHKNCIDECFKRNPQCPCCKTFYGAPRGTQPTNGRMSHAICNGSIPGFKCNRFIQIQYSFPSGIQGPEHPCPGKRYSGTARTAYLPNTTDGQRVLRLLEAAFDHRLVFTVGTSATTGAENQVIWNGIHHKTNLHGGPTGYGYPDANYLFRVEEELAAVGITAEMLK